MTTKFPIFIYIRTHARTQKHTHWHSKLQKVWQHKYGYAKNVRFYSDTIVNSFCTLFLLILSTFLTFIHCVRMKLFECCLTVEREATKWSVISIWPLIDFRLYTPITPARRIQRKWKAHCESRWRHTEFLILGIYCIRAESLHILFVVWDFSLVLFFFIVLSIYVLFVFILGGTVKLSPYSFTHSSPLVPCMRVCECLSVPCVCVYFIFAFVFSLSFRLCCCLHLS